MNEVYVLDKEFLFKSNIHEITSISLEHSYDLNGSNCMGEFVVSGDYRLHEVSINKEDFSFKVPFNNEIRSNVNLDSVEVEITDFTYDLNDDLLNVHIEYLISGEQSLIEFVEESDFEEFLNNNETEIIDLSEEERTEEMPKEETNMPEVIVPPVVEEASHVDVASASIEPKPSYEENISEEIRENVIIPDAANDGIDKENIFNSINSEESFITYHVHTVTANDTLDSICNAYNININDLKKINSFDELVLNMKLIIPDEEN